MYVAVVLDRALGLVAGELGHSKVAWGSMIYALLVASVAQEVHPFGLARHCFTEEPVG